MVRLLPSLTDVAFLLPIGFVFLFMQGAVSMLGDGDTGWHVRTGEWILRNGRVPHTDIFSYTMPGQPWFAWEWLWDVSFGWLHQRWGLGAVVAASMAVLGVTFALLFRLVLRKCPNPFVALTVTAWAAAGSSIHYLARPHLFTLLFVVMIYGILETASEGRARRLWVLPPLMMVWTNVHGGFLAGLLLVGMYAAGEVAGGLWETNPERRQQALKRARRLLGIEAACLAATLINPYNYHLHIHIYQYLRDPGLWQTISEFLPLNFRGPIAWMAEPMFLLAILTGAWNLYRRRFVYPILILVWAHLALTAARNLPIFLLIAAPLVGEMFSAIVQRAQRAEVREWIRAAATRFEVVASEFAVLDRIPRLHLASTVVMGLLSVAICAPHASAKFRPEYDSTRYPARALPVLSSAASQRIFTHDEWGDYLIYHLYPSRKVFVDGRSDFYGPVFDEKYMDVMRVKGDWERNLNQYGVDTILLPVEESLVEVLKESSKWRVVYDDGMAIVFRSTLRPPARDSAAAEHGFSDLFNNRTQKRTAARDSSMAVAQNPNFRS